MKQKLAVWVLYLVIIIAAMMIFSTLLWVNIYGEYRGNWSEVELFRRDIVIRALIEFLGAVAIAGAIYFFLERKKK